MKHSRNDCRQVSSKTRCFVVDEKDEIIIEAGDFKMLLSTEVDGPYTHVLVGYHYFLEDGYYKKIFPIDRVYFCKMQD